MNEITNDNLISAISDISQENEPLEYLHEKIFRVAKIATTDRKGNKIEEQQALQKLYSKISKLEMEESQARTLLTALHVLKWETSLSLLTACKERYNFLLAKAILQEEAGKVLLHQVVSTQNTEMVKYILRSKGDPNAQDSSGKTALHYAAETGNLDFIYLLLSYEADPNIQDALGNTPLHLVGKNSLDANHQQLFQALLDSGAVLKKNKAGQIPVFYSNSSLERLIGNANGLKDEGTKCYERLSSTYPLLDIVATLTQDAIFDQYGFSKEEMSEALKIGTVFGSDALSPEDKNTFDTRLLDRIKQGKLVILPTGWDGHKIYLVFCRGYMVICNRGERPENTPTLFARKIDLNSFSKNDFFLLRHFKKMEEGAGMEYIYTLLPRAHNSFTDDISEMIEKMSNKDQKVGNCSFNFKGAFRVGVFLLLLQKGALSREKARENAYNASKDLSTLFRFALWDAYANETTRRAYFNCQDYGKIMPSLYPPDNELIIKAWEKLEKRLTPRNL